jgi:3-hydroxyacyl-[acyl-carrier-protein] dehydratase
LLISETLCRKEELQGVPVLTRIVGAKFKREVRPGDIVEIQATLKEKLGPAWFLKGNVRVQGKIAVQVAFACALKTD